MDYEFVAKSIGARKAFNHCIKHLYCDSARTWAAEHFGPEARVERIEADETNTLTDFFSGLYVYDDVGAWAYVSGDFYFRNVDDAFEFKMRWK